MASWFVTRHTGAAEWLRRRGIEARVVARFEAAWVMPGDVVMGTLPIRLAAEVCARGGRYLALDLPLTEAERGRAMDSEEMERRGAKLVEYRVLRVAPPSPA